MSRDADVAAEQGEHRVVPTRRKFATDLRDLASRLSPEGDWPVSILRCETRPDPSWLHGLRLLGHTAGPYPFASLDSTNVGQNHSRNNRLYGETAADMRKRIDARQCPGEWAHRGHLEVAA